MHKIISIFSFLCIFFIFEITIAQKNHIVIYEQYENSKLITDKLIKVTADKNYALISYPNSSEKIIIDYKKKQTIKTAKIKDKKYAVHNSFSSLSQAVTGNQKDSILGFECSKAVYNVFSNTFEVWFTQQAGFKASSSISFCPPEALVLKVVINGNRSFIAKSISKTDEEIHLPGADYENLNDAQFTAMQIAARYIRIPVFDKEVINYENNIENISEEKTGITYRFSKGNIIMKKIKLPDTKNQGRFFIELSDWSNGDAYDRVGSVFTLSAKYQDAMLNAFKNGPETLPVFKDKSENKYQGVCATENYSPVTELMRFYTPFGVGHYNNKRIIEGYQWSDSAVYKQDVTDLIPTDANEVWIGVYIGNYDKGGHKVSLRLNYYPDEESNPQKKWISSLFSTVNIMEAAGQNYGRLFEPDTLRMSFEIPDSVTDIQLLFTTTGHGGWENGDEFVQKNNQVKIDGKTVFDLTPWRSDCGTYRLINPASGNFPDGLSSSDYSRSNWCPGTLTPPFVIPLKNISSGKHQIEVIIDQGKPEGGSFSHWCVTGILTGKNTMNK